MNQMKIFIFKIIIISSFIIYFFLFKFEIKNKNKNNIKVCLCTMGKSENLYVKEFIEYYIKLGFDQLFIYDNNNPNTEKISQVIENHYKNKVTIYETWKNNITNQPQVYTECYNNNRFVFDWLLMIDMDEFLYIVNDTFKSYISNDKFKKCDFIEYYWILPSDNNLLYYDPRPLFERFNGTFMKSSLFKTMVKGNITNLTYAVHFPNSYPKNKIFCNNEGKKISGEYVPNLDKKQINIEKAFIVHFRFKSTEEFVLKCKRGYSYWLRKREKEFILELLDWYFGINKVTLEKINYIEKNLNISLKKFRDRYEKENNLTGNKRHFNIMN